MVHVDKLERLLSGEDPHGIPEPEPRDPPDPEIPLAKDVNQNVQVLTDLDALEFARLMQAMSTWIAPEQGCEYCHNTENLASDEKYTKIVSRQMLQMTRDINTNWQTHVAGTGVTCWTCHRGKPVPSGIWFEELGPETPSAGVTGVKAGQNTAGMSAIGNASLPFDPMSKFLEGDAPVTVQGTTALPSDNTASIKDTEWTYALMMYMSNSLGVNCTYCHQTRSMGVWEQSTPQRVTAWHGIRMVRDLNGAYLNPLKALYPDNRLGPEGDAPKVGCDTCHKGAYKPLLGVSMLGDYPELAGYRTERVFPPAETDAMVAAVASASSSDSVVVEEVVAPLEAVPTTADAPVTSRPEMAPDATADIGELPEASDGPAAPADAAAAVSEIAAVDESQSTLTAVPEPVATGTEVVETSAAPQTDEVEPAAVDWGAKLVEIQAAIAALREEVSRVVAEREAAQGSAVQPGSESLPPQGLLGVPSESAPADAKGSAPADAPAEEPIGAVEIDALETSAEGLRDAIDSDDGVARAQIAELEARIAEAEARLETERAALQREVENARVAGEMADGAGTADIERLMKAHDQALSALERRVAAGEARLKQERSELQKQLAVVRAQRDAARQPAVDAPADDLEAQQAVQAELARQSAEHATTLRTLEGRLTAATARLDQERTALEQQLRVVRVQRDEAQSAIENEAEARVSGVKAEFGRALKDSDRRIAALGARLDQERTALQQQLAVVRAHRDEALASVETAVEARAAAVRAELGSALETAERRIAAARAHRDQERLALQQQLAVVRAQRDAAGDLSDERMAELAAEHEKAIRAVERRVIAAEARLDQERHALQQQLRVVRAQRDGARADADARLADLAEEHSKAINAFERRLTAAGARLHQERTALTQQLAVVRAQRDSAAAGAGDASSALSEQVAELNAKLAEADRQIEDLRAQKDTAEALRAETESEAQRASERTRALFDEVADVGGRMTSEGILVNISGDELQFPSGSATLPARELPTLDRVVALLTSRPGLTARIEGHTDSLGPAAINQALSEQRAEAVMQALIARGIDAGRLQTAGYGPDRPIADNTTDGGRRANRRVEVLMVEADASQEAARD
jgi:outer membrane protein OmpA-like peptidoglycan-associated protein